MERLIFRAVLPVCVAAGIFAVSFYGRTDDGAQMPDTPKPEASCPETARKFDDITLKTARRNAELLKTAKNYGMLKRDFLAIVDSAAQEMTLIHAGSTASVYRVSTSKFGLGNKIGSNKTPAGWHKSAGRFGKNRPAGSLFSSRKFTGRILSPDSMQNGCEDLVVSRIIWLRGLEDGVNSGPGVDSHDRCIYIHGTNQESLIGSAASHGCVRMRNSDIIELFDKTESAELYCVII